jgi:hypothetical protein
VTGSSRDTPNSIATRAWGGPQAASGIAQIDQERLDEVFPPVPAYLFLDVHHPAELQSCDAERLVPRQPSRHVGFGGQLEVVPHLVGHVPVGQGPVGEAAKAARDLAPEGHGLTPRP